MDIPIIVAIMLGVITATFGGVIRDILSTEIPLIFRKEIYATACIAGAILYVTLNHYQVPEILNTILSGCLIIGIRTIAVVKKLDCRY